MKYLLAFAAVVFLFLPGCAKQELPLCEKYQAMAAMRPDGEPVIVIDMENIKKLARLIVGLANGTCRLAPAEAQGATRL